MNKPDLILGKAWKQIEGYPDYYVSRNGKVYSNKHKMILKPYITGRGGLLNVGLRNNNVCKNKRIHRLVALAFIPNPEGKPFVNHISGIPSDNSVENLEWCTHTENIRHAQANHLLAMGERAPQARLTSDQVVEIRSKYMPHEYTLKMIAKDYGIGEKTVFDIVKNITWRYLLPTN